MLNGAGCRSKLRQLRISENMLSEAGVERRLAVIPTADVASCSRLMGEGNAGALARLAGVAHAMCEVSDRIVAHLSHICVGGAIDVTAVRLSPPAHRIIAEGPDLVPRLAGAGDDYEL